MFTESLQVGYADPLSFHIAPNPGPQRSALQLDDIVSERIQILLDRPGTDSADRQHSEEASVRLEGVTLGHLVFPCCLSS